MLRQGWEPWMAIRTRIGDMNHCQSAPCSCAAIWWLFLKVRFVKCTPEHILGDHLVCQSFRDVYHELLHILIYHISELPLLNGNNTFDFIR
jgi:hypothetical protein